MPGAGADDRYRASSHMPKLWIYTQGLIVVFVLAGMVIAITKLL